MDPRTHLTAGAAVRTDRLSVEVSLLRCRVRETVVATRTATTAPTPVPSRLSFPVRDPTSAGSSLVLKTEARTRGSDPPKPSSTLVTECVTECFWADGVFHRKEHPRPYRAVHSRHGGRDLYLRMNLNK